MASGDIKTMYGNVNDFLEEQLSAGDPYCADFFFIKNGGLVVSLLVAYIFFVKYVGPQLMQNREPMQWGSSVAVYNFGLCIAYLLCIIKGTYCIHILGNSVLFNDERLAANHPMGESCYSILYWGYLLKLIELLDTIILVTTKKFEMVSSLHVIHHSSLPFIGWLYLRSDTSCYIRVYGLVNGIVHCIMYFYYGMSSLGPRFKKYLWWKKYLTQMQITQFVVMYFYMGYCTYRGWVKSKLLLIVLGFFTAIYLILFLNFYRNSFSHKNKVTSSKKSN